MDNPRRPIDPTGSMDARTTLLFAGIALAPTALLLPRTASADVPSPELEACGGKATGDACNDGNHNGTCQPGKCSRLDYSKGTPPGSVEFDCVKCTPGPAPAAPAAPTPSTQAAVDPKQPAPAPTPQASGCAIAGERSSNLALLLLLGFARRRRASSRRFMAASVRGQR